MTDIISKEKRSWNMSRIRSKNTKPEIVVRSAMHRAGFRFRLHVTTLPGKPDIVLPKHKAVIFVNGCFWHRHQGCKYAYTPKSRQHFWENKFHENVERQERVKNELYHLGWNVIEIWECEVSNVQSVFSKIDKIKQLLNYHKRIE
jgi:DNA mismatch endonuclease (patch repair protein)